MLESKVDLNPPKPSKYFKLLDEKVIVHTEDLGGRVFLVISKGRLSSHVAEIMPFEVSWAVNADSDSNAIEQGKNLAKTYFQNLVDAIK